MRSGLSPFFALPLDGKIRLLHCYISEALGDHCVITSNIPEMHDHRMILLRPAHGGAISVAVVYYPTPNLISQRVATALGLTESHPLIAWQIHPALSSGRILSLDGSCLDCGACAVRLPPHGLIYYSTTNPHKQEQLQKKLSPVRLVPQKN